MASKGMGHAGTMINEDYLKGICNRTAVNSWKCSNNKLLPRAQHSAFGDFPATHMPKKEDKVEPLANTGA